jgi:hypothetical protein
VHYLTDNQRPYYVRSEEKPTTHGFVQTVAVNVGNSWGGVRYDFYIPRGSIVQSYKLDNQ